MSDIHLSGFLFNASGAAISGATVEAFAKNTVTETGGTPVTGGSTTTNSSGYYTMTVTSDNEHDIRITSGNSVRWRRFDDRLQMEELEVSVLNIREGATAQVYTIAPGSISADRTLTLPAATGNDTLASLGLAQTFTAAQTFTGAVTVGSDGSGVDVIFYSGTAGDNMTWDASEELLTITGTNGQTALNVADGNVTIADNLTVSGNLTVTGTTTSVDSTTINAATAFVFEGATANCYETTLAITDPTADRTIYLPNQSGYLPVLASASTTQVGSTPEELNFLDGSAKSTSSITICDADAFIVIDGTTTKQIPASDITTYVGAGTMSSFQLEDDDGTEVAISNAKEVKIIGSGVTTNWTDTDNGTDGDPYDLTITVDAAQTGITSILATDVKIGEDDQTKIDFEDANTINFYANNAKDLVLSENSLTPGTSDGTALGTTSLMWSDLFLASGSVINFNNGDVTLTHSACTLTMAGGTLAAPTILATDIKIGEDDQTKIDFACANIINLHANNIKAASIHNTSSKGDLRLYEGCNYVSITTPSLSGDWTLTLPANNGSCGQVLTTDGCGVASWACASGGGGGASALQVNDSVAVALGTGSDSKIYYDGTDTHWDLLDTGSGDLVIAQAASHPSPDPGQVHLWAGDAGSVTATTTTQLTIEDNTNTGISILTPAACFGAVYFGSPGSGCEIAGGLIYNHGACRFCVRVEKNNVYWMKAAAMGFPNGAACAPSITFTGDTNTGLYHTGTADTLELIAGGGGSIRLDSDSKVFIKETANGEMARGLTINQGGYADEIFALKSSCVGHPTTGSSGTEADTFFSIKKITAGTGGARLTGWVDGGICQ